MANKKEKREFEIDGKVNIDGQDSVDSLNDSLGELTETGGKLPGVFGEVSEGIGAVTGGLGKMTKAALTFIATPLGAVLAAIVAAIVAIKAAFNNSEEGQNKFAKLMSVAAAIGQQFVNVLAKIGDILIDLFTHPIDTLKKFGELIKENIINRFDGLLELIPALGTALSDVFHGKFSEAAKVAGDAILKVTTGVDHAIEKIGAMGDALDEVAKKAQHSADLKAKADKLEETDSIKKAQLEASIADLREKMADKDQYTAAQRKKFAEEAQAQTKEMYKDENELYNLRKEAADIDFDLSNKNKEAVEAHNKVIIEGINLQKEQSDATRTIDKAQQAANREDAALAKEAAKAKAEAIKEHEKEIKSLDKEVIKGEEEVTNATLSEFDKRKAKANDDYQDQIGKLKDLLDNKKITLDEYNKYALAAQTKLTGDLANAQKAEDDKHLEEVQKAQDSVNKIIQSGNDQNLTDTQLKYKEAVDALDDKADKEQKILDDQLAKGLISQQQYADAVTAINSKETADIQKLQDEQVKAEKEANKKKIDDARKKAQAELALAQQGADAIGGLADALTSGNKKNAKSQFETNKALQLVNAVINGAQAVITSLANSPPVIGVAPNPAGIAALAFIGATTAASIAKIAATQFNASQTSPSSGGGGPEAPNVGNFTQQGLQQIGSGTFNNPNNPKPPTMNNNNNTTVVKAYVTQTDIASSSNQARVLQKRGQFNR